jgi:hypothetical protein
MASVADIQTSIWEDLEALTDDALLLYVWAFSNTNINPAGLYKIARRNLAAGRLTPNRLDTALQELADQRLLYYTDGVLWVRTHVKHYRTKSDQTAKSIVASLRRLTGHPLAAALYTEYRDMPGFPKLVEKLQELADEGLVSLTQSSPEAHTATAPLRVVEPKPPTARQVKHSGKVVPPHTLTLAEAILASFNEQARTKYGAYTSAGAPSSNLSRILTAVIAHPEIDTAMAAAMIRNQLASPYWTGPPDAGNVFGGNALEKNLEAARRDSPGSDGLLAKALR